MSPWAAPLILAVILVGCMLGEELYHPRNRPRIGKSREAARRRREMEEAGDRVRG